MKIQRSYFFLIFIFIGFIVLFYFHSDNQEQTRRISAKAESNVADFDGPHLAAQQDFERTKDPKLGYVPRERLYQAYLYAEKLRQAPANKKNPSNNNKTLAAISGITWTERGPNNVGGRTRAIMVDPNDGTYKTVFVGGADGGLWKTTDITAASPTWTPVNDLFGNMAITTIAYSPASTTTMYFGTGEGWFNIDGVRGDGIWKSTDGGTNWSQLGSTVSASNGFNWDFVQKIVVDASGNIYAATRSYYCNAGGLYKSTNGGTSWTLVLGTHGTCSFPPDTSSFATDIEIAADGTLYASLGIFQQGSIWKSATGNYNSWTKLNTGGGSGFPTSGLYRVESACAPLSAATVYAMTHNSANNQIYNIYKSTDAGVTWAATALPADADLGATDLTNGQAWYDLAIAVDPNSSTTLIVGGLDLFRSTDGGSTWAQISKWSNNPNLNTLSCSTVHSDHHAIVFIPSSSSTVLFGNDGGIYYTTSVSTAATNNVIAQKNNSYNVTQFFACALDPVSASNYFLAGAQDNGSHKFTSAGVNSTTQVTGGDGGFCHIDQDQSSYQFTAYVYQNFYRSTNSGGSFTSVSFGNYGQFINPSDYDNTANIFYAGDDPGYYFRWNDPQTGNSSNFFSVAAFAGGQITAVTVSPNTANRVFFGLDNGKVVKVDAANGGSPSATDITGGSMPSGAVSVSCIAVETGNDNHLLATYSNYGITSVWESTNLGTAWTSVENNLPDMPVRWALFNPNNNTQALLATELGVWTTDQLNGTSTNWGTSNSGLANVRVDMLKTRSSDKVILAATHGRGLFSTSFFSPAPIQLISFSGIAENGYNLLSWKTATEINNDRFEIQRSEDGTDFKMIGVVDGAGNSDQECSYEYKDYNIQRDLYYYRFRQVDFDGSEKLSNAITILSKESIHPFSVFPNPFEDEININLHHNLISSLNINLFDISGKQVYTYIKNDFSGNKLNLDLKRQNLIAGIYYLKVVRGSKTSIMKLVKM